MRHYIFYTLLYLTLLYFISYTTIYITVHICVHIFIQNFTAIHSLKVAFERQIPPTKVSVVWPPGCQIYKQLTECIYHFTYFQMR